MNPRQLLIFVQTVPVNLTPMQWVETLRRRTGVMMTVADMTRTLIQLERDGAVYKSTLVGLIIEGTDVPDEILTWGAHDPTKQIPPPADISSDRLFSVMTDVAEHRSLEGWQFAIEAAHGDTPPLYAIQRALDRLLADGKIERWSLLDLEDFYSYGVPNAAIRVRA